MTPKKKWEDFTGQEVIRHNPTPNKESVSGCVCGLMADNTGHPKSGSSDRRKASSVQPERCFNAMTDLVQGADARRGGVVDQAAPIPIPE